MSSMTYLNVLVAMDGSVQSEWAVLKAIEICRRNDASLFITYVIEQRAFMHEGEVAQKKAEQEAKELLNSSLSLAKQYGVEKVEVILEYGTAKHDIAKRIAPRVNADVIVCGKTGETNPIEHLFLGSVSEGILKHAKCDVLIVKKEKK